jgi:DNA mismatch repair protein MutH
MQTIAQIHEKCIPLLGKEYTLPIAANKGLPGHFLEDLLGIPHTPNALDCSDGELKVFPVKKLQKSGKLSPKESIAVTMLNKDDLKTCNFNDSKCCKKMSKMLVIPYYRKDDKIQFLTPVIVDRSSPDFKEMYSILESDYNEIRQTFLDTGVLESKTGTLLQNRTKGAGHGTTSRAFYLRPEFAKRYIPLNL